MKNVYQSLLTFFSKPNLHVRITKHLLISAFVILSSVFTFKYYSGFGYRISTLIEDSLVPGNDSLEALPKGAFQNCDSGLVSTYEKNVIKVYYKKTAQRAIVYFRLAETYYKFYFAFVSMSEIYAILAAIMLLFIFKTGLFGANEYVLNIFLCAATVSLLSYSLPQIFKDQENMRDSMYFYDHYIGLRNEILSYSNQCTIIQNDSLKKHAQYGRVDFPNTTFCSAREFIHYLEHSLNSNFKLPIEIDYSKVNTIETQSKNFSNIISSGQ